MEELSEDQIEEFKEAFSLFADNKGEIQTKDLRTVLHSLGINASDKEIEYLDKDEKKQSETISFSTFLKIIEKKMSEEKPEDCLNEAFSLFLTEDKKEIKVDNLKKDFSELLPDIPSSDVEDLINFFKEENKDIIKIKVAIEKLSSKRNLGTIINKQ